MKNLPFAFWDDGVDICARFIAKHNEISGMEMGQIQQDAVCGFVELLKGTTLPNGTPLLDMMIEYGTLLFPMVPVNDFTVVPNCYAIDLISGEVQGNWSNTLTSDFEPWGVLMNSTTKRLIPYKSPINYPLEFGAYYSYNRNTRPSGVTGYIFHNGASSGRVGCIQRHPSNSWSYFYFNGNFDASLAGGRQYRGISGIIQTNTSYINRQGNPAKIGYYVERGVLISLYGNFISSPSVKSSLPVRLEGTNWTNDWRSMYINYIPFGVTSTLAGQQNLDLHTAVEWFQDNVIIGGRGLASEVPVKRFVDTHETSTGLSLGEPQKDAIYQFYLDLWGKGTTTNGSNLLKRFQDNGTRIWPLLPTDNVTASPEAYKTELITGTILGEYYNFVPGDFSVDGVTGGDTKYFDTTRLRTDYSNTNVGYGVYSKTSIQNGAHVEIGGLNSTINTNSIYSVMRNLNDQGATRINDNAISLFNTPVNADLGLWTFYRNGTNVSTFSGDDLIQSRTSSALSTTATPIWAHAPSSPANSDNYSTRLLSMYLVGLPGDLTTEERQDLYEAVENYETNRIGTPTLTDYLVAYYSFEDNMTDSHKYGLNGDVAPPGYTSGLIGQSANFPGITNITGAKVPDNDRFSFTDGVNDVPFSISTWVKFDAFSSTGNWLIDKRDNGSNREWQLVHSTANDYLSFAKFSEGGSPVVYQIRSSQSNLINIGEWYHIVVTDEGTGDINDCNIYLNGVNVNGGTVDLGYVKMNNGNKPVTIGQAGFQTGANTRHTGQIDETAIYKGVVLTQQQITTLYNGGLGLDYTQTIEIE